MVAGEPALAGLSILLVEDDQDNREVLSLFLRQAGAAVTVASSATEALALFKAAPPAVMLTDIATPLRDGIWLLRSVRALPGVPTKVVIIALSAHARVKDREDFQAAGFDAFVAKPFDPDGLVALIRRLTGRE